MSKHSRRVSSTLLCTTLGFAIALPVAGLIAAEKSTKDFMHERHEHYEELGKAFKTIRDQSRGSTPDVPAIQRAAKVVNDASVDQARWFPAGTGPETGIKTRAKAEIWAKPQDFEAAQKQFSAAAPKL